MTIKMLSHKFREYQELEIYPIGDLHIGSREFQESQFQKLSRYIMEKENRYIVIVGDIVDNGIKSSVTSPYDAVMQPKEQRELAAEILFPLITRVLCGTSGNHEYRSRKDCDTDPLELIMSKLNLEHLFQPDIAFLNIAVGDRKNHDQRPPKYSIAVTHGTGGGLRLGASLSKCEPFAISMGVDLLITGHSHKPATAPTMRFEADLSKGVMVERPIRILVSTGWLSYDGYPARKMYNPVAIAPNHAILNGTEHNISIVS